MTPTEPPEEGNPFVRPSLRRCIFCGQDFRILYDPWKPDTAYVICIGCGCHYGKGVTWLM